MAADKSIQPNLMDEILSLRKELDLIKRVPKWRSQAFPVSPLGAVRDFGYTSLDTTTYADFFRGDILLTAPILDYDIGTTNAYESTPVTSIDWRIVATVYFIDASTPITTATVASGSSSSATWTGGVEQFSALVDLSDPAVLGPEALYRIVRFDFECKRTGGSGDGAALRMTRPPLLRIPS